MTGVHYCDKGGRGQGFQRTALSLANRTDPQNYSNKLLEENVEKP